MKILKKRLYDNKRKINKWIFLLYLYKKGILKEIINTV